MDAGTGPLTVEIWSDVVCPWCYLGKHRFERALARFDHRDQVVVIWRSFELNPEGRTASAPMAAQVARRYGVTVAQAESRLSAIDEVAASEGLELHLGATTGARTFDLHRLLHLAAASGRAEDLGAALFRAYFTELRPVGEPAVAREIAVSVGLPPADVDGVLASSRYAEEVRADERAATELGVSGVPFFLLDGRLPVPGAQDPDVFLRLLERAWDRWHRPGPGPGAPGEPG